MRRPHPSNSPETAKYHENTMHLRKQQNWAFTIIELLVVITVIGMLGAMVLPALARTKSSVLRIYCTNNLKQAGVAFHTWAALHGDRFPMKVNVGNGGYADYVGVVRTLTTTQLTSRGVFGCFVVMSNEFSTPGALICPAENEHRIRATTFDANIPLGSINGVLFTNDLNTSYFIGVDAALTNPKGFLCGDHNLGSALNSEPFAGFVTAPQTYSPDFRIALGKDFSTNGGVAWLNTMHLRQGNVVLADCSVQQYNRDRLRDALRNSGDANTFAGNTFVNPPGCSGGAVNRIQFP
jgi:hypothetical protein